MGNYDSLIETKFFHLLLSRIRIDRPTSKISCRPRHEGVNISIEIFCGVPTFPTLVGFLVHINNGLVKWPSFTS